jgi:hypothetical protein
MLPGSEAPQRTVHFTGSVRLSRRSESDSGGQSLLAVPVAEGRPALTPEQVYALYFHGPAYQVVGSAWRDDGGAVGRMAARLGDNHAPADAPTVIGPRLVELCFQTAGLLEAGKESRLALPRYVDRLVLMPDERGTVAQGPAADDAGNAFYALARPASAPGGGFDCTVIDGGGRIVLRLDGYRTVPLPMSPPEDVVAPMRDVFTR